MDVSQNKKKGLFIRADKIGDLVLSLPVDFVARHQCHHQVEWLITRGTQFVMDHAEEIRPTFLIDKKFSFHQCLSLIRWLRHQRFDYSVTLFAPWWVQMCLFLACIPVRTGRASQWHSFLFLNFPVRQSRKTGAEHETWLGYQLWWLGLSKAGMLNHFDLNRFPKSLEEIPPLVLKSLIPDFKPAKEVPMGPGEYVVIHAGMAGSALNWPLQNYVDLAARLVPHRAVFFTGTDMGLSYLTPIKEHLENLNLWAHPNLYWKVGQLNSNELMSTLARAKAVVAPSTGVLHLAASVGARTIGIYSPIPVQRSSRWGSRGPKAINLQTEFLDDNKNENQSKSQNEMSHVMSQITVDDILKLIE